MAQITEIELNGTSYELADMTARNYAYTKAQTDAAYVAKSGDTMTGALKVKHISAYGNNDISTNDCVNFNSGNANDRWYADAHSSSTITNHTRWAFDKDGNIYFDHKDNSGNYPANVTTLATYNAQTSRTANTVLAAPNGSNGAAVFRALVTDDIPSLPTSKITSGTFGVARGGTGASTLASGEALIGNGTSAVNTRAITNNTSKGDLGWSSGIGTNLVTLNTLAYWNGSYNSTTSNITTLGTITSGTWNGTAIGSSYVDSLPASKITSGTFDAARIPNLNASKITAGTLAASRLPSTFNEFNASFINWDADITPKASGTSPTQSGNASAYPRFRDSNSNTLGYIRQSVSATNQTYLSIAAYRHSSINSSGSTVTNALSLGIEADGTRYVSVSSAAVWRTALGVPATSHNHAASDITSGTFDVARIPELNASKITAGTLGVARGGTGSTQVTESTSVSNYITAASGVTISDLKLSKWGKVVSVFFKATPSTAKTAAWTVGTVTSTYRPNNNVTSRPYYSSCECAQLTTAGTVTMTAASANAMPVSFTYLLA